MKNSKITWLLFVACLFLGFTSAQAACTGCTPIGIGVGDDDFDDPTATYSAIVTYITWHTNAQGQRYHRVNYLTLTGSSMTYCQQQLNSVTASPNVSVVQYCQKD